MLAVAPYVNCSFCGCSCAVEAGQVGPSRLVTIKVYIGLDVGWSETPGVGFTSRRGYRKLQQQIAVGRGGSSSVAATERQLSHSGNVRSK